jgi:hypothetical protein
VVALGGLGVADGPVALAVVDGADHQLGVAEEGDAGVRGQERRPLSDDRRGVLGAGWVVMVFSWV